MTVDNIVRFVLIEDQIQDVLKKMDKSIDDLPEPSSAEEAQKRKEVLMGILETLEQLKQTLNSK